MTFIKPTSNYSPFATSTAMASQGATAYNQAWVSVTSAVATISGEAISTTAGQSTSNTRQYYYDNHSDRVLAGHLYYTSFQTITESSDECLCVDSSFELIRNGANLDTSVSRTNIIKVEP
jgi:hypothetical protein|tara:strand:+ start:268 stop:627 length:360 start_codon:yes stop_codon:yes gene_type:complete